MGWLKKVKETKKGTRKRLDTIDKKVDELSKKIDKVLKDNKCRLECKPNKEDEKSS